MNRFTLSLDFLTSEALNQAMIDYLREQGYFVEFPRKWETCVEFRRRVGITAKSLSEQLRHPSAPRVDVQRGPSGRLVAIASNSRFETFCRRHKKA
jgi:hypothetical protein